MMFLFLICHEELSEHEDCKLFDNLSYLERPVAHLYETIAISHSKILQEATHILILILEIVLDLLLALALQAQYSSSKPEEVV